MGSVVNLGLRGGVFEQESACLKKRGVERDGLIGGEECNRLVRSAGRRITIRLSPMAVHHRRGRDRSMQHCSELFSWSLTNVNPPSHPYPGAFRAGGC